MRETKPKLAAYTHLVFLASEAVPAPTIDDLVSETRQTYGGPLQVGEDLMQFEIGDGVTVRQCDAVAHRSGKPAVPKSP